MLAVGAPDTGKTTFIAWLANVLGARGFRVGIVDADVGQSEIGPPATVGLGAVHGPIERSGNAALIALEFVGATSPGKRPWQTAAATGRLVARARGMFERVLVDTSGFVAGDFAAAVKGRKIAAADPDVVVVIQAADESEHLVRPLTGRARPRIVRLPAVAGARPRTPTARRQRRAASLSRYLGAADAVTLAVDAVRLVSLRGDAVPCAHLAPQTIVAIEDLHGDVLGVGVVEDVDPARGTLRLRAAVPAARIAVVRVGETTG